MKIIDFFGDSLGRGVVYDGSAGRYGFTANNFVNLVCEKFKFAINNFSKFGCTVTKGLSIMQKKLSCESECDFAVIEYGGNDSDFKWAEIAADPEGEHLPNTPLVEFGRCYDEIIDTVREKGKQPIIVNLPPIDAVRYFNWVSRGVNGDNILKWLGGDPNYIYRYHEMYNMRVCVAAVSHGVPLLDVRTALLSRRDYRDFLCEDGIHLNACGHELVAERMEQIISSHSELIA